MSRWPRTTLALVVATLALQPTAHPISAATLDYGFLKDAFVDAPSAGTGEVIAAANRGPFGALTQPALLARGSRSAVALTRASIFEDRLDDVELSRWGLVTGWGPIGIGLAYSQLEWGTYVVPENFFTFEPERSFDVVEEEYRAGLGMSLARALRRSGPLDFELGVAASRYRVQVPSSGDPDEAVPVEATLHSMDLGAVLSYTWEVADPAVAPTPVRRVTLRLGSLARDLASPETELEPGRGFGFEGVMRHGVSAEFEFGEVARFGPAVEVRVGFQRGSSRHDDPGTWETGWFGEIAVLGMLSVRRGHHRDPAYGIDDDTLGIGLALDWDSLPLGLRLDWAERPLARLTEGSSVIDRFGTGAAGTTANDEQILTLAVTFGRAR